MAYMPGTDEGKCVVFPSIGTRRQGHCQSAGIGRPVPPVLENDYIPYPSLSVSEKGGRERQPK